MNKKQLIIAWSIIIFALFSISFLCSGCYWMSDAAHWEKMQSLQHIYFQQHPDIDPKIKELLLRHNVTIGMTKEQVRLSGNHCYPTKINKTNKYEADEVWVYYRCRTEGKPVKPKYYLDYENLYFKDDILIKIETIPSNKKYPVVTWF